MSRRIHGLFLTLEFPEGIAPGAGGDYNVLMLARNGKQEPVLRGTALAGALRHAYWNYLVQAMHPDPQAQVVTFFGAAAQNTGEASSDQDSRLKVSDGVLDLGNSTVITRTYHLRHRHTGAVANAALFSMELCPPGTQTTVALWLTDDDEDPEAAVRFLSGLVAGLEHGVRLGGNAARGIGRVILSEHRAYRLYQLDDVNDHAAWLNDHRAWRQQPTSLPVSEHNLTTVDHTINRFEVRFELGIPRGQDILIGDGQGDQYQIEPQRVKKADGKLYWRLPGSSLRGLFRSWVTHLAAREGKPVADTLLRQQRVQEGELAPELHAYTGNNLGWCFASEDDRRQGKRPECPVSDLFGSLFHAGRIHIADAYAPCSSHTEAEPLGEEQHRMHVAVDRITGGAAESMLFDNTVLTAYPSGKSPVFQVTMRIQSPTEDDVRWLAKTLQALDLGLLRIGSSKSSGRLGLVDPPSVVAAESNTLQDLATRFTSIEPLQKIEV
jgi:CRISPR/Cas system CSM-associated protein Csm3 (group 7 of RAMP superfamily)